jgi:hypothetical protein
MPGCVSWLQQEYVEDCEDCGGGRRTNSDCSTIGASTILGLPMLS